MYPPPEQSHTADSEPRAIDFRAGLKAAATQLLQESAQKPHVSARTRRTRITPHVRLPQHWRIQQRLSTINDVFEAEGTFAVYTCMQRACYHTCILRTDHGNTYREAPRDINFTATSSEIA